MAEKETSDKKQSDHYAAVLADLRARRAELEIAIIAIEKAMGAAPSNVAPGVLGGGIPARSSGDQTIRPDEFFNMSILDATEKYLNIVKKPQSLNAIVAALTNGGFIHQSKNFGATVFTTLRRAEDRGDRVLRVQKNWGLTGWYPNRPRPMKEELASKKAKKKRKAARAKVAVIGGEAAKASGPATPAAEASQAVAS